MADSPEAHLLHCRWPSIRFGEGNFSRQSSAIPWRSWAFVDRLPSWQSRVSA